MKRILALLLPLSVASVPAAAADLGRLFHTPDQRNALDAARKGSASPRRESEAESARRVRPARVDGYVFRPDGRSTVWVNGRAETERSDARAGVRRDNPGGVAITEGNRRIEMKVGATLDSASPNARDLIGEGEISVRRP